MSTPDKTEKPSSPIGSKLLALFFEMPWPEIIHDLWVLVSKAIRKLSNDGMYEVLDYESTLEIHDSKGQWATFRKHKQIRYLQDNVFAYQDYAWGDGEILLNYRTNRGVAVDRYRSGYKTYILLSLREIKNRGDLDELDIQWDLRRGFLTSDGYWSTDVSQPTKHIKINVIFPQARPPSWLIIEESNHRRTYNLEREAQQKLSDGRWLVSWETRKPRLYEVYVLRWNW